MPISESVRLRRQEEKQKRYSRMLEAIEKHPGITTQQLALRLSICRTTILDLVEEINRLHPLEEDEKPKIRRFDGPYGGFHLASYERVREEARRKIREAGATPVNPCVVRRVDPATLVNLADREGVS